MLPTILFLATTCAFNAAPTIIEQSESALYESWTLANGTGLLAAGRPAGETYTAFLAWVRAGVDPEQTALLERQRKIYAQAGMPEEVKKFDLILKHQAGRIHPSHCLEQLLFNEHLVRQKSVAAQTEFAALILTRGTDLKIYFTSGFQMSPPTLSRFDDVLTADLATGWSLTSLLHNHIFFFGNAPGDIAGTTIPSNPDVETFLNYARRFQLKEAWITNGIDSITMTAREFELFRLTGSGFLPE
ncbi:MAG: hypothetical protein HY074_18250 [Deltaproteobacteria bacterium]|nr:hypothetical protein [Deltaproteobacteria bacterium]